jgi:phosphatidylglycerol:prolipoprotein diacylglycerol transferase
MNPMLWKFTAPIIGRVEFPSYMTLLLIGFSLAIWLAGREEDRLARARPAGAVPAPRWRYDSRRIFDLGIGMLILGVLGARLLSVLADEHFQDFVNLCVDPKKVKAIDALVATCSSNAQCGYDYLCNTATHTCYPPQDCLAALKFWQGGLAYYGGFVLAVPFALRFARKHQLGIWRLADVCAPVVALGLFFGRMGCFLNGCCFGQPTALPWGVDFPQVAGHGRVHPTQLYEALGALALFCVLSFYLRPRKRRHGQVFAGLLVGYGTLRFFLEFLRADERGAFMGLSTSQWIGIPLVAWGIWIMLRRPRMVDAHGGGAPPQPAPKDA